MSTTILVLIDRDGVARSFCNDESLKDVRVAVAHLSGSGGRQRLIRWSDGTIAFAVTSSDTPEIDPARVAAVRDAGFAAADVFEPPVPTRRYQWKLYPLRLRNSGLRIFCDRRSGRLAIAQSGERRPEDRDMFGVCWIDFTAGLRFTQYGDIGIGSGVRFPIISDAHGIGTLQPLALVDALAFATHFGLEIEVGDGSQRYVLLERVCGAPPGDGREALGDGVAIRTHPPFPPLIYLDGCVLVACPEDEVFAKLLVGTLGDRLEDLRCLWDEHVRSSGPRSQRVFELVAEIRRDLRLGGRGRPLSGTSPTEP